jgi:hypothetical protein
MNFCQEIGISSSGGKIEIANRITEYLETGKVTKKATKKKPKLPKATQQITKETVIGIEYRTYNEKKDFLQSAIGNHFHFTIHLLDYFNFLKKRNKKKRGSPCFAHIHSQLRCSEFIKGAFTLITGRISTIFICRLVYNV